MIAWRNVWRNKLRSSVVFASVVLGIWAGLFVVAITMGMLEQQTRGAFETQVSHLKIHTAAYLKEESIQNRIPTAKLEKLEAMLKKDDKVKAYTKRSVLDGTGTSAHGFSNLKVIGIDPEMEKQVSTIYQRLDTGNYFTKYKTKPVLVGRALADELHLEVGKSVKLSFQDVEGTFVQTGFKVEGIFSSPSSSFDKSNVFILKKDLERLVGVKSYYHEIGVILNDFQDAKLIADKVNQSDTVFAARTWAELAPDLSYRDEVSGASLMVILVIIVFALSFGILNTMLMAVLERKRELGMLLCVGMNKTKVFLMVMIETIFLAVASAPIGLLLSWASITYFGSKGISLISVGDALYKFGMDSTVFPSIPSSYYMTITVMIVFAAIIASIVPARRALKYNPAEAVRAV